MEVLVISKSFIVREAMEMFFSNNFKEYKFRQLKDLKNIGNLDLSEVQLMFIDIESDIIDRVSLIKKSFKNMKVVVLNKTNDKDIFIKCLKNKIESCIFDINEQNEFLYIIKTVISGKKYYDLDVLEDILSDEETLNENSYEMLTKREHEVLDMVGLGCTNKEIAKKLYISEHTVKKHITSVLFKLDMKNRKDLIIYIKDKLNDDIKFAQLI